jgi:hypothetical protein
MPKFSNFAKMTAIGFTAALFAGPALAQMPSTSTNKDVPEHGTASSKTPSHAAPIAPGPARSGQRHLPKTTDSATGGSAHGSKARSPANAAPKTRHNTGAAPRKRLPATGSNKSVPEHGTSTGSSGGAR